MTAESIDTYVVVPEGAEEKQRKEFWLWSDVRQVCHFFGVDPDVGLAPEEVARRLRPDVYGPNDIFKDEKRRLNFFKVFMSEIREPMIILLLVVGVVYSIWGDAFDAITIFIVITVMVLAEVYNEFRAKNAVLALRSIVPRKTTVLRRKGTTTTTTTTAWESGSDSLASPSSASIITEVLNEELVPGDILVLRAGQCIPADARVIESFSLEVDESALTGESVPVRKHAAPLITTTRATNNTTTTTIVTTMAGDDHNEILSDGDFGVDADADAVSVPVHAGTGTAVSQLEKLNTVYAGTTITRGKCHAVVVATGESTQVSQQVLRLMSEQPNTTATTKDKSKKKKKKNKKTPLQKAMKQLALYLTVAAVVCSIIIPLIGWVRGMPWRQAILAGLSIAFATIPEELPILIKAVLAIGALRLSRKNLLIKKLETAEALGAATVVVTDKTGTLTQNKLHLTHVITTPIWRDDDDNNNNNQYHVFGIDQPLQCKNDNNNNNNSNNNNNNDVASWTNDLLKSFMLSSELIDKHGELVPQLHGLFNEEEDEEAKAVIIENNVCDSFEKAMLRSLLLQSPTSTSKDHNVSTYRTLMRDQLLDIVDQFQQHDQQKGSRCQGMMHRLLLEIPFDAKRKCITIARDLGVDEDDNSSRRILIVCKGAPESIIALAIGTNTSTTGLDLMAAKGLRLIAIASQQVTVPKSWIEESKGEDNPVSAKHNKYHAPSEDGDLLDFVTKLTSTGKGFTLHGLLAFEDPVRPEVADSIAQCRRAGIEVIMITGDHPATASAVAKKIGLLGHEPENDLDEDSYDQEALMEQTTMMVSDASFIEKARLEFEGGGHAQEQEQQQQQEEGLSDSSRDGANIDVDVDVDVDEHDNLIARLRCQRVYSRATPRDKHSLVWMLQRLLNHRVIVTGDGINDGPALQLADVGVAMGGKTSTDVAREAAGMILVDDNFATLLVGIREGRKIYDNLRKAIHFYLACKTALVLLMASTITFGVALPLSPIQIIILELFMDLGASTTFIVEREESDKIMNKPPRDPKQRFVNVEFLLWVFSGALSLFLGVLVCFLVGSSSASSSASEDRVARGQSMAMACWLLGHFFLGFNFRSFSSPLTFKHGLASNPGMLLWGLAVAATVVLTATVPWMRSVLKLVKISRVSDWAVVFACSFCFTWWYELAKIIRYFAVELPRQTTSRTRQ